MEYLKELGVTGWPAVITVIGLAICFVSLWNGWPWEGIITINKHYHCDKCEDCEEDND